MLYLIFLLCFLFFYYTLYRKIRSYLFKSEKSWEEVSMSKHSSVKNNIEWEWQGNKNQVAKSQLSVFRNYTISRSYAIQGCLSYGNADRFERYKLRIPIYISNISGLRDYTNYIEVRISVEYVGPATCVAHTFSSYGIFTNLSYLFISPEYANCVKSSFSRGSYGQPSKMIRITIFYGDVKKCDYTP